MKVAERLEKRRENWHELDRYCQQLESQGRRALGPATVIRFAALYRSVCGDLALAEAYQLPGATVGYLHQLIGRAHNHLYRSRRFLFADWAVEVLVRVPQRLFQDNALRLAFVVFWGFFLASMLLAYRDPGFAESIVGLQALTQFEDMYSQPVTHGGNFFSGSAGTGFYVQHNAGIGLRCFAAGLILGIGGLFITVSNAITLGTVFGYMTTTPYQANFYQFVTAHGPFELTAIVLSAAAGMRLGFALIATEGYTRREALIRAGRNALPIACVGIVLFCLAAVIEAFISPSGVPYEAKAAVAAFSTLLMMFYFVVLGWPRGGDDAA